APSVTRPARRPSGVRRRSALSCRSKRRYSARLVNKRYGSSTPRVTRSSRRTPMKAWLRSRARGGSPFPCSAALTPARTPRAAAGDLPGIHRRPVEVGADEVVDRPVGGGDVAVHLRLGEAPGGEAERPRLGVAGLRLALREVDGPAVEAAGGAGLEAGELEA